MGKEQTSREHQMQSSWCSHGILQWESDWRRGKWRKGIYGSSGRSWSGRGMSSARIKLTMSSIRSSRRSFIPYSIDIIYRYITLIRNIMLPSLGASSIRLHQEKWTNKRIHTRLQNRQISISLSRTLLSNNLGRTLGLGYWRSSRVEDGRSNI